MRTRVAVADAHSALNAHRATDEPSGTSAARLVMLKLGALKKNGNKSTNDNGNSGASGGEASASGGSDNATGNNSNGEGRRSSVGGGKALGTKANGKAMAGASSSGEEWVIGERFGERELFVFLDQRCRTPSDALDELAKLKGGLLSSIVLP